jgi:hypothetical protein
MSVSQIVMDMKLELNELAKLGVLTKPQLAKAIRYVDENSSEFCDTRMYSSVSSAVDCVVDIVGGDCGSGRCG